jgi:hypothetical protein
MKTVVVLCDPERIDTRLISSLQQLFPECEIKLVFTDTQDTEVYPLTLTYKKAHA